MSTAPVGVVFEPFESIARLSRNCVISEKPKRVLSPAQKDAANARQRRWVAANRSEHNARVRESRKKRYQEDGAWRANGPKAAGVATWIAGLKAEPCSDCWNRFDACCMDFDHRDGSAKSDNVGSMVAHHYNRDLIEAEVAKCDLVCANCHRIRTRNRRTGSGTGGRGR